MSENNQPGIPSHHFVIYCPNCRGPALIEELNCGIFRHGAVSRDGVWTIIPSHATALEIERMTEGGELHGCGKPFQVIIDSEGEIEVLICDYI